MDDLYDSDRMIVVAIDKLLDGAYEMRITDKAPCLAPEQAPPRGGHTHGGWGRSLCALGRLG